MKRLIDRIVFALWDRFALLRPIQIRIALRADRRFDEPFLSLYYRFALRGLSKRGWRYLESRYPQVVILWCVSDMPAMTYRRAFHAPE